MRLTAKHWWPPLALLAVMFVASTDIGSDQRTAGLLDPLLRMIYGENNPARLATINAKARKAAHVMEYALLGFLVAQAFRASTTPRKALFPWRMGIVCLTITAAIAAGDEFHQRFVPSRRASVRDVALNTGGAAIGLMVALGVGYLLARRRRDGEFRANVA